LKLEIKQREKSEMERRNFCTGLLGVPMLAQTAKPRTPSATWDLEGQARRRAQIYALYRQAVGPLFDPGGKWIGTSTAPGARERLWNCFAFLDSTDTREKANAIIEETFAQRARFQFAFSHFEFIASTQLLIRDKGELSPPAKALLLALVREALQHQGSIQFLGYNDNFPAMENVVATLGGELLDDAAARKRGTEGMHRVLDLLSRRGLLSEYTSATYSPVTTLCYSDIVQYSQDAEARQLALEIERLVWTDLAAHFHPPTNILAGPHSRAYQVDSVGHFHQLGMIAYQAFGGKVWMNPVRFMFPPVSGQVIHHDGDVPFMQVSTVWLTSGTYHPTREIEELFFNKHYPFRVSATSEFGAAGESIWIRNAAPGGKPVKQDELFEYPAGHLVATTYMTEDYAAGSATTPFLDGNQTDTFFVNFRRAEKPDSLKDVSTIFSRYTVDDDGPGRPWTDPRNPGAEVSRSLLGESGRVRTVQKDGTVIVAYQSKGQFTGDYKGLRLTIVVPEIYRRIRRILFEGREVELPFRSVQPGLIALEDDFFYTTIRPLSIKNHGRPEAVRLERMGEYLAIQLINYEGAGRSFSRKDLVNTLNGFVAETGGVREYGSFAAFQARTGGAELADRVEGVQRIIRYTRPGVALDLSYSIPYDGLKYALVDGQPLPETKLRMS
jgi:hypothetical protein